MSDEHFNEKARQAMLSALEEHGLLAEEAIANLAHFLNANRAEDYEVVRRSIWRICDLWHALQKPWATLLEEDAAQEADR